MPSELRRPWDEVCERAELPGVIPYALRHSSIVRGIRAGLPIRLVAALHDTSAAMIERHYSKWIVDGLEELAARAVVPLVPREADKQGRSTCARAGVNVLQTTGGATGTSARNYLLRESARR